MGKDLMLMRLRQLRSRAEGWLTDKAAAYSGFDAHMKKDHPPAGLLHVGGVVFRIETVEFTGGKLKIRAVAGAEQAGQVKGKTWIGGTDGLPVLQGRHEAPDMGIKTTASTWTAEYALDLRDVNFTEEGTQMTATFPPPYEAPRAP
jgi:hypothetical protein